MPRRRRSAWPDRHGWWNWRTFARLRERCSGTGKIDSYPDPANSAESQRKVVFLRWDTTVTFRSPSERLTLEAYGYNLYRQDGAAVGEREVGPDSRFYMPATHVWIACGLSIPVSCGGAPALRRPSANRCVVDVAALAARANGRGLKMFAKLGLVRPALSESLSTVGFDDGRRALTSLPVRARRRGSSGGSW